MRSEFETLEQYQDSMKKFNENTRTGFENFIQSHGSDRNKLQLRCTPYTSKKGGYGSFDLDFGLCVYQHQQSKVDELQKQVTDLDNRATKYALDAMATAKLNAELQKRVDALEKAEFKLAQVKAILQNNPKLLESILVKKIKQALKGGGDE